MDKINSNMHMHMNKLCLDIGSKHCGSPELDKAGQYVADTFRDMGYEVIKEEFPVRGWEFKSFSLYNVTEGREVPVACPCFFSNSVDITDTPFWITFKNIDNLENLPVKGRLCFVANWIGKNSKGVFGYNSIAEKLDKLGAAAAIFLNRPPFTQLAPSTKIQRSPFLNTLGTAAIAQAGAIYMVNHKNDVYHLKIEAKCFDTTAYNVIARIGHGSLKGVVGAHYDTAPLIQGAQDNIGGTVVLMEMARLMKKKLLQFEDKWTIDFVAFSAEEYIPHLLPPGSGDYVERHKDENIKWYLNIDDVAPHFSYPEFAIGGIEKLPPLKFPYDVRETTCGGDDKSFAHIGVPSIWMDTKKIYAEHHTELDNLEYTDFERMYESVFEYNDVFEQLINAEY